MNLKNKIRIVLLAIIVMTATTNAIAQEPSELIAIADAVDTALNAHDMDLWLSYLTDDPVFDYVPLPTPMNGKEEIRSFFEDLFVGFPDIGTIEGRVLSAGNIVVVEHIIGGTHLGVWQGIPPTGNTGPTPHIDIYEFEGDKIKRMTTYLDVVGLMVQLGVMPVPEIPPLVPSFTLPDPEPTGLSPLEANAELLARWNAHDMASFAKMIHPDAKLMESAIGMADRDTFIASSEQLFQGFSDMRGEFVRSIDMGDGWVAIEAVFTGTHDGMFNGIPATGRVGMLRAASIRRFDAEGLLTDLSLYYDNMTIMTQITANSFADFGSGTTTQLFAGGAVWQLNWGQGPWTWSDSTDQPLLDPNVSAILDLRTTAAADVSADLVATLPIGGTLILSAHDEVYKDVTIGTMILSGAGINVIDINASRVIVDEESGMFLAPFHPPGPKVTLTLEEVTGVFAYINQVGPWELSLAGSYAIPLIEGLELQDNIMTALGGNVALIGGIGEFALTGQYTPDMSKMVKSFCEYGTAVSLRLGAGGALWEQTWGKGSYEWFQCDADPNAGILNENISGMLETTTAGAPQVDENLVLSFDFGGNFALTDHNDINPDEIAGQILGDVEGTFVADMNAANAVVDETAGTIVIAFGAELHDDPDALITITETTGTFASIQAVGLWKWHVIGTITCARVPDLSVQDNIMAALGNNDLLLGAEEEIVLSGSYYRSLP